MGTRLPAEWYIEIDGKKAGPYTVEQIHGLLEDGQIRPEFRVTCERLNGQWVRAQELLSAYTDAIKKGVIQPSADVASHQSFHPPPRPENIERASGIAQEGGGGDDPALALFESLLSAREKKSAKLTPPDLEEWGYSRPPTKVIPGQVWFIIAMLQLVGISIWGLNKLNSKSTSEGTQPLAAPSDSAGRPNIAQATARPAHGPGGAPAPVKSTPIIVIQKNAKPQVIYPGGAKPPAAAVPPPPPAINTEAARHDENPDQKNFQNEDVRVEKRDDRDGGAIREGESGAPQHPRLQRPDSRDQELPPGENPPPPNPAPPNAGTEDANQAPGAPPAAPGAAPAGDTSQ